MTAEVICLIKIGSQFHMVIGNKPAYLANVPVDEDVAAIEISVNNARVMCMEIFQDRKSVV